MGILDSPGAWSRSPSWKGVSYRAKGRSKEGRVPMASGRILAHSSAVASGVGGRGHGGGQSRAGSGP